MLTQSIKQTPPDKQLVDNRPNGSPMNGSVGKENKDRRQAEPVDDKQQLEDGRQLYDDLNRDVVKDVEKDLENSKRNSVKNSIKNSLNDVNDVKKQLPVDRVRPIDKDRQVNEDRGEESDPQKNSIGNGSISIHLEKLG